MSIQKPIRSRQALPVLDVAKDRLAALGVELGDPVLLDLRLVREAQLLLDLQLDRQPVAVPAALAGDPLAGHRVVARVDVLEDPGEDVRGVRLPVRGGRALVEAPQRRALALGNLALEHVALAPALEDPLLKLGEGLLRIDFAKTRHERAILRAAPHGGLTAPLQALLLVVRRLPMRTSGSPDRRRHTLCRRR